MSDAEARFSLVAGEGDGVMLGVAAGDTAGGAWKLGYSAVTEQATVIAYHLIERGRLETEVLAKSLRELDGSDDGEEPVYRAESPVFRAWLDRAAAGGPSPIDGPSLDPAPRSTPLGVTHRRQPERLTEDALALGRIFHSDPLTILGGVAAAAAVAASCFGQSGRDLIFGVIELVGPAIRVLGLDQGPGDGGTIEGLRTLPSHVGVSDGAEALALAANGGDPEPWALLKAGLLLSAPVVAPVHVPVEQAAKIGGSALGAMVGAIVGARAGIRAWPWAFANDTWFAEMGRRLARGPGEVKDLPIPYAVEQHLMSGARQGMF